MTNIRSRGFDSPAQFREHIADLDDYLDEEQDWPDPNCELRVQLSQLKDEVRDLRRLIVETRNRQPQTVQKYDDDRFWLRLAATVAATLVLTAAVRYFRLGQAGAVVAPLIASRINGAV